MGEVAILADLATENHPNLCQLVGIVVNETQPLSLLFELCSGGALAHCLQKASQVLACPAKLALLSQVASAIAHLHGREIIHRDLKSNNVLLAAPPLPTDLESAGDASKPQVSAKVADVGLARWVAGEEFSESPTRRPSEDTTATLDLNGAATPLPIGNNYDWRAPEMVTGQYGVPVDIYAFGILMLEILTWSCHLPPTWREALAFCNDGTTDSPREPPHDSPKPPRAGQTLVTLIETCLAPASTRPRAASLYHSCGALDLNDCKVFQDLWRQFLAHQRKPSKDLQKPS